MTEEQATKLISKFSDARELLLEAAAIGARETMESIEPELRRLHAENEALKANHKIVGYTTKPIAWNSERHHSEQIMKITQRAQPEHGFVHPVYAVCNSVEHDHA